MVARLVAQLWESYERRAANDLTITGNNASSNHQKAKHLKVLHHDAPGGHHQRQDQHLVRLSATNKRYGAVAKQFELNEKCAPHSQDPQHDRLALDMIRITSHRRCHHLRGR